VHDDRLDAEFATSALDAQGNFAPVGDKDFPEHAVISR
jgi:hypothetical protein